MSSDRTPAVDSRPARPDRRQSIGWVVLCLLLCAQLIGSLHLVTCGAEEAGHLRAGQEHPCARTAPAPSTDDGPALDHDAAPHHDCALCAICVNPAPASPPAPRLLGLVASAPCSLHAEGLGQHPARAPPGPSAPRAPPAA